MQYFSKIQEYQNFVFRVASPTLSNDNIHLESSFFYIIEQEQRIFDSEFENLRIGL